MTSQPPPTGSQPAVVAPGRQGFWAGHRLALLAMGLAVTAIAIGVGVLVDEKDYWLLALPAYITGIGTLALAGVTVWIARTDRRRDDERASTERQAADKRALDEWNRRRAELQHSHARELIEAVEEIKYSAASLIELPLADAGGAQHPFVAGSGIDRADRALTRLRNVCRTTAILAGNPEIRRRLSQLLVICNRVRGVVPRQKATGIEDRLKADVIAYCVYTVAGIEQWASYQKITAISDGPVLFRQVHDHTIWTPSPEVPPNWQALIEAEPLHPQYRLIRDQQQ